MKESEILELFQKTGAFLRGHFKLSSGMHSSGYLQCALLLKDPIITERLSRKIAESFFEKH